MKTAFYFFWISIFYFQIFSVGAQGNECFKNLEQAEKYYQDGLLELIPPLLEPCKNKLDGNDRVSAYRLLINTYLVEDSDDEARKTMLEFLSKEPEYQIRPSDPVEFTMLYSKFRTSPIYSLGVTISPNITTISLLKNYGSHQLNNSKPEYAISPGFQVGGHFSRLLAKNLDFNFEFFYLRLQYKYEEHIQTYTGDDFVDVSMTESQQQLAVPVSVTWKIGPWKTKPYLRAGVQVAWLMSATGTPLRTYLDNSNKPIQGPVVKLRYARKKIPSSAVAALGINTKIPRGNIFFELRYNYGLINAIEPARRYANSTMNYEYWFTDNDIRINTFVFHIGYTYAIYKPKLLGD